MIGAVVLIHKLKITWVKLISYSYFVWAGLFGVYSYALTNPNIVLSSNPRYWEFQQVMWQLGYHNRTMSAVIFGTLISLMYLSFSQLLKMVKSLEINLKTVLFMFGGLSVLMIATNTSLSNDLFNYLMNGKIIYKYHDTPYIKTALDYPNDPWIIFMTNVHTATPYGKVWTFISTLVYAVSSGYLQLGMLLLKLLGLVSIGIIGYGIYQKSPENKLYLLTWWLLNPLVLIETIANPHNDIVMMAIFFGGVICGSWWVAGFWLASVWTKLVTIILPPIWVGAELLINFLNSKYILGSKLWGLKQVSELKKTNSWWFWNLSAIAMVAIMFFDGSRRFYSWYMLWSLPMAAMGNNKLIMNLTGWLSFGAMLSYLVYLYTGTYNDFNNNLKIWLMFGILIVPLILRIGKNISLWQKK